MYETYDYTVDYKYNPTKIKEKSFLKKLLELIFLSIICALVFLLTFYAGLEFLYYLETIKSLK